MVGYIHSLKEKRVAVKVKRADGRSLKFKLIPKSLCIVKAGTLFVERPEAKIIDGDGNELIPSGRFLWSAETIDPFHLVVDMF